MNEPGTEQRTVNSVTVFALVSEANSLLGHEVRTLVVNGALVNDSYLVPALREDRG